ncbi:MAG: hypothetical protein ACE5JN_00210 [Candidatus Methylomirabilia bacterium]
MAVDYNPRLPEVIADPYRVSRQLQREDPMNRSGTLGGDVLARSTGRRPAHDAAVLRLTGRRLTWEQPNAPRPC